MLVDKQTYFENYHHQKNIYHENNWSLTFPVSQVYLALLLVLLFFVNVSTFSFKSAFFTILEISDLLTNSFFFIFALKFHL